MRHLFVVGSLDKQQMQNEKELIRLASAKGGGDYFVFVWRVLTIRLDLTLDLVTGPRAPCCGLDGFIFLFLFAPFLFASTHFH